MKISVLLPYKENFSEKYAGAVSIFVKDIALNSEYLNSTQIFGYTTFKKILLKKYINIPLKKNFFKSTSKVYVEEFLKKEKKFNSDIIEIHNRPNYIKHLNKVNKSKVLY